MKTIKTISYFVVKFYNFLLFIAILNCKRIKGIKLERSSLIELIENN